MTALEEALVSARQTRTPLVVSHLKCAGPKVWGRAAKVLARLDEAQREQSVAFDIYPYDASSTMLRGDRLKGARKVIVTGRNRIRNRPDRILRMWLAAGAVRQRRPPIVWRPVAAFFTRCKSATCVGSWLTRLA